MSYEPTCRSIVKTRVFLVDDHPIVRRGFQLLLGMEPDLSVCGEADSGPAALQKILALKPDVAVIDLRLPGKSGLELLAEMKDGIFVSGDLDEYKIASFLAQGAPLNGFGVGTALSTSRDAPALGGIYKMVEVERRGLCYLAAYRSRAWNCSRIARRQSKTQAHCITGSGSTSSLSAE